MAKQRLEVRAVEPSTVGWLPLTGDGRHSRVKAIAVPVETRGGDVTLWDQAKAYYHTIFAAVTAVILVVVDLLPAFDPALALLPTNARVWVTVVAAAANLLATRLKSNEVWKPASTPASGTDQA